MASWGRRLAPDAPELPTNQVTHFDSAEKDAEEMIRWLDALLAKYADCEHIYSPGSRRHGVTTTNCMTEWLR
jgi:hypothetical protein